MNSLPATGRTFRQFATSDLCGQQHRISLAVDRYPETLDEQPLEALLEAAPHLHIIPDEVAGLEQQIPKVERAALRLRLPYVSAHRRSSSRSMAARSAFASYSKRDKLCLQLVRAPA